MLFQLTKSELPVLSNAIISATAENTHTIIGLQGDLGAGKTTFVKEFARALGIRDQVSSPTYAIENEYVSPDVVIRHVDCFRGLGQEDIEHIFSHSPSKKRSFLLIEWVDLIEISPKKLDLIVSFNRVDNGSEDMRMLSLEGDKHLIYVISSYFTPKIHV